MFAAASVVTLEAPQVGPAKVWLHAAVPVGPYFRTWEVFAIHPEGYDPKAPDAKKPTQ